MEQRSTGGHIQRGTVTRQNTDTLVTLTATISKGAASDTKTFALTVLAAGKTAEPYIPDFIEYPSTWISSTVAASSNGNKVVFTASAGSSYQNTKLNLGAAFVVPEELWDDTYLVYDFDATGGKVQITMSYTDNTTNTTVVNLGQLMANNFEGGADHYHGGQSGRLSIRQIVDYINTRPDAGWGHIEAITNGKFYIKEITIWFSEADTSVSFHEFRIASAESSTETSGGSGAESLESGSEEASPDASDRSKIILWFIVFAVFLAGIIYFYKKRTA